MSWKKFFVWAVAIWLGWFLITIGIINVSQNPANDATAFLGAMWIGTTIFWAIYLIGKQIPGPRTILKIAASWGIGILFILLVTLIY
jgi:hypothetical protein